ncbi:NADH dehydrogenase [ubiquinone] 1 beta subcomplex subunit 4 [Tenebrio molitor]|jgi:NADH dehydrogenase (ubiquinone) 1 beta subcomplex subunit 4|uniref:NADH dehydrogenase [ubiquinone] 1 beta subcomplex subunit 4 n=1 Tax=Tenebrio molitor TaxID=7067 RepID=UPI001C3A98EA|nr:unnamed protein product [Tenebrio molitor]
MADQYDITPERRKVLEENAKRRTVLRNEFLKQVSDPFRHASGEGGTVFDPALTRYQAMRVSTFEHFKPNAKNAGFGMLFAVIPILGYAYLLHTTRSQQEQRYRSGQVAYKDRDFKLI